MEEGGAAYNLAALTQSNGFSILGGPSPDRRSLGEAAATSATRTGPSPPFWSPRWRRGPRREERPSTSCSTRRSTSDPSIGLFVTYYEPDPLDGGNIRESKGSPEEGGSSARGPARGAGAETPGWFWVIAPLRGTVLYRTGKYDRIYRPSRASSSG